MNEDRQTFEELARLHQGFAAEAKTEEERALCEEIARLSRKLEAYARKVVR